MHGWRLNSWHHAALRGTPEIARFLEWIANKEPNFHAPTHRRR
jgi:hypothetical protein